MIGFLYGEMTKTRTACKNDTFCEDYTGEARGWAVVVNDETGKTEIQRCDACDIFASDEAAVRFVATATLEHHAGRKAIRQP